MLSYLLKTRYSYKNVFHAFSRKPNPAQWESKVFQQAEDLIDNTHLQLFLTNLEPDTDYHMQIRIVVMAQFQPTSDVLLVRTPAPCEYQNAPPVYYLT